MFGNFIGSLQLRRKLKIYKFDAFDPAKIGFTKEEDWEKFAEKAHEIMRKVLDVK